MSLADLWSISREQLEGKQDVYRIDLETLATYRRKLIVAEQLEEDRSSILIVVGREDTGDLEAQIRGW